MPFIGKESQIGSYSMLDALTASATASYSLTLDSTAFVPESANHLLVSLNGVIQKAGSSYTVSGSTLTFSSSLASSDSIDFVLALGNVLDIGTPSDATVTNAKTNFVSTSSSAGLQIKGDGTTDGTLQLNCSQNSHGIKLKSPNHASSSSYTLTFPATDPSADKFLKTDGSGNLSFADAGGGDLVKLTQANSTTDVSVVNVDSIFSSIYSAYRLVGTFKPTNSSVDARFRWRASSSDLSVSQYYGSGRGGYVKGSGAGSTSFSEWGSSYATIAQNLNNNNYNALQLDILLYPYNNTGVGNIGSINNASSFIFAVNYWRDASGEQQEQNSGGYTYTQTTVADGFALYPTAGDWDGYNYAVFGYKG